MMVSRTWVQVAALVVLFGFTVLGFLAFRTYETGPPIADRVLSQDGTVIFTGADVTAGQELFLKNGLMEYGSVFGHGAYLGPDFTADYLHRAAVIATGQYGGSASDTAQKQVIKDFKTNQYDAASRTLTYTSAQATAFEEMVGYYANYFGPTSHDKGLVTNAISDRTQIRQLSRSSPGPPGQARRCGRTRTTATRTLGPRSRWSATRPPPTYWCGASCP